MHLTSKKKCYNMNSLSQLIYINQSTNHTYDIPIYILYHHFYHSWIKRRFCLYFISFTGFPLIIKSFIIIRSFCLCISVLYVISFVYLHKTALPFLWYKRSIIITYIDVFVIFSRGRKLIIHIVFLFAVESFYVVQTASLVYYILLIFARGENEKENQKRKLVKY